MPDLGRWGISLNSEAVRTSVEMIVARVSARSLIVDFEYVAPGAVVARLTEPEAAGGWACYALGGGEEVALLAALAIAERMGLGLWGA